MFWARLMHPFLTTHAGQAFFTVVSRFGLLPFIARLLLVSEFLIAVNGKTLRGASSESATTAGTVG